MISVVGCSHGNTALKGGNEALAIGRANRVKEALLYAGVESKKVLEEGCWANIHYDDLPRRGVVIELKRKKS